VKKSTKRSKDGVMGAVNLADFVSIGDFTDNGDGTYTLSGIEQPGQMVGVQVYDCNGNSCCPAQNADATGPTSWEATTPEIIAEMPFVFVAQAGDSTATYAYPPPGSVSSDTKRKKKPAKKPAKKSLKKK
jgi:hypothetical protein